MSEHTPPAFISYSREDSEFALRLAEDLKAAGASVWLDQLDIEPGRAWDSAIEKALIAAPRMLLILSPSAAKSNYVRNEISFALDEQKIIIPILHQDCVVPLQLRRIQWVDFRTDYARGVTAVMKLLVARRPPDPPPTSRPPDPPPTPRPKRKARWKRVVIAAAVLLIVFALCLVYASISNPIPISDPQPNFGHEPAHGANAAPRKK